MPDKQAKKTVTVYGDSVMKGVVFDASTGKYRATLDPLIERFSQERAMDIVNRSQFGSTIDRGMRKVEGDLSRGLSSDYALIEYGGNDCNFRWDQVSQRPDEEHDPATPIKRFKEIYIGIVQRVKDAGITPILMTLPPIDAEKYLAFLAKGGLIKENILKWLGDAQMIYRYHELYSNCIRRIAVETGNLLVDVREYFLDCRRYRMLICEDGLHVTPEGQKLIYKAFADFAAMRQDGLVMA